MEISKIEGELLARYRVICRFELFLDRLDIDDLLCAQISRAVEDLRGEYQKRLDAIVGKNTGHSVPAWVTERENVLISWPGKAPKCEFLTPSTITELGFDGASGKERLARSGLRCVLSPSINGSAILPIDKY